ncbi:MAG TPA: isopentenyl-diphosphate Delta-isomerase [Nevskiaceae bacterium]
MAKAKTEPGDGVSNDRVVSFDDEPLVLVDARDNEVGFLDKAAAHRGSGTLHRAFSLFVLNGAGELLLQQRAAGKRLWGGYWSNSCCSHPRRGETMDGAIHRRLQEELGFDCVLQFLFKFEYQAQFDEDGAEHELCWVYLGKTDAPPNVNATEISATRWLSPEALDAEMSAHPERFTPWFKLEWTQIKRDHTNALSQLL